jgi:hypothetical protein
MKFVFIAKHRAIWPVAWLCEALDRAAVARPGAAGPPAAPRASEG